VRQAGIAICRFGFLILVLPSKCAVAPRSEPEIEPLKASVACI
jgi:hypothetical protein